MTKKGYAMREIPEDQWRVSLIEGDDEYALVSARENRGYRDWVKVKILKPIKRESA